MTHQVPQEIDHVASLTDQASTTLVTQRPMVGGQRAGVDPVVRDERPATLGQQSLQREDVGREAPIEADRERATRLANRGLEAVQPLEVECRRFLEEDRFSRA